MGIVDKAKELKDKATESGKADEVMAKAREKLADATGKRSDDQAEEDAAGKRPPEEELTADGE